MKGAMRVLVLGAVACLVWLAASSTAEAQTFHKVETVRPELHLSLGPGVGTGFQIEIPVHRDGWLEDRRFEDELVISPGFEFFFHTWDDCRNPAGRPSYCDDFDDDWDPAFGPFVTVRWNVYLNETWSVFPEAGIAFMIVQDHWIYHYHDYDDDDYEFTAAPVIGGGARWHFSDRGALVMRLVFPFGFQFGVAF